jgi:hypothetical protein
MNIDIKGNILYKIDNDAGHRSQQQLERPIFFSPGAFDEETTFG